MNFKPQHLGISEFMVNKNLYVRVMCAALPIEAVLQTFANGADVSGVSHCSAVQRVVLQING